MKNSDVCVLIAGVGGGGTGAELIKAFKLSPNRYKLVGTDMWKNSFGLSEVNSRYVVPPATDPSYIDTLLKICKKEHVQAIATGSEPELKKVANNAKLFEENDVKVLLNPINVIELCTNKYSLMKFLSSHGINCPKSFIFEEESDLENIDSYPVIVKPSVGGGSQNVFLAQDFEEVQFFSKYLKKYGFEPLIQEYVGTHEDEFTVGVLFADNGKICTSIAMKRMLGSGLSTRQTIINPQTKRKYIISSGVSQGLIDDFQDIRKEAENIAKIIGANGPINIQCRKTDKGIIPFEINPRFSGTTGSRSLVGYNEPDIFCRYKLFGEIPTKIEYKFGYVVRGLIEKFLDFNSIETQNKSKIQL